MPSSIVSTILVYTTPEQAEKKIEEQRKSAGITEPQNLEERAQFIIEISVYRTRINYLFGKFVQLFLVRKIVSI